MLIFESSKLSDFIKDKSLPYPILADIELCEEVKPLLEAFVGNVTLMSTNFTKDFLSDISDMTDYVEICEHLDKVASNFDGVNIAAERLSSDIDIRFFQNDEAEYSIEFV